MRHLRDIGDNDVAGDALSEDCAELALGLAEFLRIHHFTERYALDHLIRHLDTYRRLIRDRRFDTNARCREVEGDIVHKSRDLGYLYARCRLELVAGHGRTARRFKELRLDAEAFERIYKRNCVMLDLGFYIRVGALMHYVIQQLKGRESVLLAVRDKLTYALLTVLVFVYDSPENACVALRRGSPLRLFAGKVLYCLYDVAFGSFRFFNYRLVIFLRL